MTEYQIILYKLVETRWHYVRLATRAGKCLTESGVCGNRPTHALSAPLPPDANPQEFLREKAISWGDQGYGKPSQQQLQVMTLHFQMKRWSGYPAGAPWFDDWRSGYIDPIQNQLEETCNGIPRGNDRFSGNYMYYYVVFNTDAAIEMVDQAAAAAPVKFLLDVHIGRREKQVQIPIDPNVPEYLRTLFRVVEKSARTIASELPVLFQGDPFQPEPVREHTERVRVTGEVAQSLRKILEEKWNFTSNFWDPLTPASPVEVVFLNGMEESKKAAVVEIIRTRVERPLYLLDCEEGLFEISPEQIFSSPHEGMVFDAGFNWVVYFSHHYTITFSGDWLLEAVKSLYAGQEERLNSW